MKVLRRPSAIAEPALLTTHAEDQLSFPPTCSKPLVHQVHLPLPCSCHWREMSGRCINEPGSPALAPREHPALNTPHSGHWLTWDSPSGGLGGERPGFLPADL